jgi:nucleoid-associated protein YgaU
MPNGDSFEAGIEPQRNTLAAIAAGVLVVVAGFLVYNYFSRVGREAQPEVTQEAAVFEEGEINIPEPEEAGQEDQEGIVVREEAEAGEEADNETQETSAKEGVVAGTWTVKDHQPNSLSGDSYTVQKGDTLWEIAEARYGSGFDWGKILEANKDSIGFLPNGSQALIEVGQTLVLPS